MKDLGNKRPKCAVEECNNEALVYFAGQFICGECMHVYEQRKNKRIQEELRLLKGGLKF